MENETEGGSVNKMEMEVERRLGYGMKMGGVRSCLRWMVDCGLSGAYDE